MAAAGEDRAITRSQPLPVPSVDNEEFYRAARRGELCFQRCTDCRAWRHYPRPACPDPWATVLLVGQLENRGRDNG